jgi:hypothetical protein
MFPCESVVDNLVGMPPYFSEQVEYFVCNILPVDCTFFVVLNQSSEVVVLFSVFLAFFGLRGLDGKKVGQFGQDISVKLGGDIDRQPVKPLFEHFNAIHCQPVVQMPELQGFDHYTFPQSNVFRLLRDL